jgi:hypothetical protein
VHDCKPRDKPLPSEPLAVRAQSTSESRSSGISRSDQSAWKLSASTPASFPARLPRLDSRTSGLRYRLARGVAVQAACEIRKVCVTGFSRWVKGQAQGLEPGGFKLWVNCILNLYSPPPQCVQHAHVGPLAHLPVVPVRGAGVERQAEHNFGYFGGILGTFDSI